LTNLIIALYVWSAFTEPSEDVLTARVSDQPAMLPKEVAVTGVGMKED
jgi:hypothetical protein